MKLIQYQVLIHLAKTCHFGNTSRHFHMTISTLSRMIQRLEAEWGVCLFERSKRHVKLSPAGEKVRAFAEKLVESYTHLHQDLQSQSGELSGAIKLYSTVTAAYHILPSIIKSFRDAYPQVTTYLETGPVKQGYVQLQENLVDVTIGIMGPAQTKRFKCLKILETPLCWVQPLGRGQVPDQTLQMILPKAGDLSAVIDRYLKVQQISPVIHSYVDGHEAILAMVAAGLGAAILPEIVVENSHLAHAVNRQGLTPALPVLEVGLFMKAQAVSSPVKAQFWDFMAQVYSE